MISFEWPGVDWQGRSPMLLRGVGMDFTDELCLSAVTVLSILSLLPMLAMPIVWTAIQVDDGLW